MWTTRTDYSRDGISGHVHHQAPEFRVDTQCRHPHQEKPLKIDTTDEDNLHIQRFSIDPETADLYSSRDRISYSTKRTRDGVK